MADNYQVPLIHQRAGTKYTLEVVAEDRREAAGKAVDQSLHDASEVHVSHEFFGGDFR